MAKIAHAAAMMRLEEGLFGKGQRVACAVSGGADSTALLVAMVEANGRRDGLGVELSAVHVHHGLRGDEADGDEAFVRDMCERMGVPLTVFRVDTRARMEAAKEGLEEAARGLRYEKFAELAVDCVATAHTLDDQAETVVMKMLRGAWTEGLSGIALRAEVAGTRVRESGPGAPLLVVRPMLGVRRAEVEAFLRARGQRWREDSSNRDTTLTRNRVRHELMPMLRSFNPGVDELLAATAVVARDEEAYWQEEVGRVLRGVLLPGKPVRGGGRAQSTAVGGGGCALEVERLKGMPAALRRRVVRAAVRSIGGRMSAEETAKVLALGGFGGHAGVTGKIGSRLELGGGLRVERSARELQFSRG